MASTSQAIFTVAIKADSGIESANGQPLASGTDPLAYSVKSRLPVLSAFSRIDSSQSPNPDDTTTNHYEQFSYTSSGTTIGSDDYYGFRLQYQFSEDIASIRGRSTTEALTSPDFAYYLGGAGTSSLLAYSHSPASAGLPNESDDYSFLVETGSLIQSTNTSSQSSATWQHLVYLTQDESDFEAELSEHSYSIVSDSDYIDNKTIYSYDYPTIFGGYGSGSYGGNSSGTLFLDTDGNPARVDESWLSNGSADSNATLIITYEDFGIVDQDLSIPANTSGTLEDGDYLANLNIFSFLDKIEDNVAAGATTAVGLGFDFTFATPIATATVEEANLSQFEIIIDGVTFTADGANQQLTFTYHYYDTTSATAEQQSFTYDIFANSNISYSAHNGVDDTILHLNFQLSSDMLEYGFDLPSTSGGRFQVTLKGNSGILSQNGKALEDDSQLMAYTVNSRMPLLSSFARIDADGDPDPSDTTTGDRVSFAYEGAANTISAGDFYGFQLRYGFSEAIATVLGADSTEELRSPNNAFYLDGAGTDLLAYLPSSGSKLPNTDPSGAYTTFTNQGSVIQSSQASSDPDSTTWDHYVYLTDDPDDFEGELSTHSYTIIADSEYINDGSISYNYPTILGGYGSNDDDYAGNESANLFLDEHGNPARVDESWLSGGDAEANATLEITFEDFGIFEQSLSIADPQDGSYRADLNIFSFLDKIQANIDNGDTTAIGVGFNFTFSNSIVTTSVDQTDFSQFAISIDGTNYSVTGNRTFSFDYLTYDAASNTHTTTSITYDIFNNAEITFSDYNGVPNNVLHLNFELTSNMLESGFDLPNTVDGLFQVTLLGNSGIVSANGKDLEDDSAAMAYTVNSSMPLLSGFARVDEGANLDPSDATIDTYATVSYSGSGIASGTFSGIQLRYQFSEDVASVLGANDRLALTNPTNAFYLSGAGSQSLLDYTLDALGNPSPKLPDDETDQYSLFLTEGSFVQSTSSTNNDASSTTWDHFAYLTVDEDNFVGEISQHTYSIIADSAYIVDTNNYYSYLTYPNLLGGYGSGDYAGTSNATLFLDEHGNPARVDASWLAGEDADANATISLTFEDFTLIGASHSIQDSVAMDGDANTSTVNIFGFLDQINADVNAVPSLDFDFTFNTTIDTTSVSIVDDFIIELGAGGGTSTTFAHASYDSSGAPTTINEPYDFSTPGLSTNGAVITISFPITDTMLEYGFDLTDNLRVYLNPDGEIKSASGIAYSEGSDILAYEVKSRMPLVTDLAYVPSNDPNNPSTADLVTTDYSTIDYNDGINSPGSYFGFVLQYSFDEAIESVQGRTRTQNYVGSSSTDVYYYLEGAGTNSAPLLAYSASTTATSKNLPDTTTTNYQQFLENGALVNFPTNNKTKAYQYAYLTDTEDHFAAELSVHSYQLVGDDNYINAAAKTLPAVLGGYGSGGAYSGDNSAQNATLLFDTDGNPVRVDANFTADDRELEITYEVLALSSQNFIIADTLTQTVSADDTTVVNMFGFLDQLAADPATLPSFGVQYTFSSSIDADSVSKDDFAMQYGNTGGDTDFTVTLSDGTNQTYDFYDAAQVDVSGSTITIAFPITARMLSYGIDLPDLFQISISATNDINTTYGTRLDLDATDLAATTMYHDLKSEMPYLLSFHFCDNGICSDADDTLTANHYTTTYGAGSSTDDFYGFQFSYRFHEQIHSLSSPDGADPYTSPANSYYLDGAGASSLLDYTELSSPAIFDSSTSDYARFVTDGSLVGPANINNPLPNTALYHYTYLSDDLNDLALGTSEHLYQIVYDADYISVDSSISLPILFGGYGTNGYTASSNQSGTLFLDEHGNPARFPDDWISGGTSEDLARITIQHDSVPAELVGASALDVAALDSDGIADDYNGAYGTYGNSATFAFALTFSGGAIDTDSFQSAILWDITSSDSTPTGNAVDFDPDNHASDDGTNFVYTFYYEIEDIYAASGTYAIEFVGNLEDTVGNVLDQSTLNSFLAASSTNLCDSGTCQFANEPLSLLAATFDPPGGTSASGNTTAYENLDVTLTFSAPVSFVGSDLTSAFRLTYTTADGDSLGSTSNLADTLISVDADTSSESDGAGAYTQHVLSIQDSSNNYWAQNPYTYGASILSLFFQDLATQNSITYTNSFATASGTLVTLPTSIQDGYASSGTSTIRFGIAGESPQLVSAAPVAASGDNVQGDAANERHVQFEFNGLDPSVGDSEGMHILFRTTDDDFDISDATAPYYGAEGGLVLTGSDLSGDDIFSTGYHICPPFSKHLDRIGSGINFDQAPTYDANRLKIHYLVIPYDPASGDHLYTAAELAADSSLYGTATVDFSGSLPSTEPCVRSAFYNDGAGQYGYVVDSDMEEQHMVIANAMLQNQSGDSVNLGILPTGELEHVYFDLYSKDYYNDSWRKDLTITAQDLLDDLSVANLENSDYHRDATDRGISGSSVSGVFYSIDDTYLSIFASRFVNTINARFVDSVFLDSFDGGEIPAYNQDYLDKHNEILAKEQYDDFANETDGATLVVTGENDFFHPDPRNQNSDALASQNDDRLILSIGVHPAAIQVDVGNGPFNLFETDPDNFLKMNPEFYGLYYGGVANSTEPDFDYTSRHLAYINFDLVYNLQIDNDTGAITGYELYKIISPFTLLYRSFFQASELYSRQINNETYSAVAASIADNAFRHNFSGAGVGDPIQSFVPYGLYCYQPTIDKSSTCYNDYAQMLLPDPNDPNDGYPRTVASQHNLHRGVVYIYYDESYRVWQAGHDSIGEIDSNDKDPNNPHLLERFMRLNDGASTALSSSNPLPLVKNASGGENDVDGQTTIDNRAYSSMLYNSFDRAYGYDYSYSTGNFAGGYTATFDSGVDAPDGNYASDAYEQQYWGLSPYAESPDARADQILPNAFLLGGQVGTPYNYQFLVQPYQYSGFTQQINSRLSDPDYLINKNTVTRGLLYDLDNTDLQYSGAKSLNLYGSFAFPKSSDISSSGKVPFNPSAVNNYTMLASSADADARWFANFPYIHISGISAPHAHGAITRYAAWYDSGNIDHAIGLQLILPQYHSGRTMGYYATNSISAPIYALHESFASGYSSEDSSYYSGFAYRSDLGARPTHRDVGYYPDSLDDGTDIVGTLTSSTLYNDSDKQRLTLPHHEDDYDFDRGQIMAHKLGFFLDDGNLMDIDTSSSPNSPDIGYTYSRLFFPSDPATITAETRNTDPIVTAFDNKGLGEVANYYPLVLANESLHTASNSWPVLLTRHQYGAESQIYDYNEERGDLALDYSGQYLNWSAEDANTRFSDTSNASPSLPIALDKIFPDGYRYQLGFVNREELFMYDSSVGNGDNDSTPVISRFYASAVGHFGYATQYSRLNRRSMQKYHLGTSSQFLGDHLARFESAPGLGAGVHISNDIEAVFAHTPANQGGTGTNYGSYGEGDYDITTGFSADLSGTWRSRTYSGSLRGYVLELRTNPIETLLFDDYESGTNSTPDNFPTEGNGLTSNATTHGAGHPD